ncbi:helix-turn-helix domain-containing protein [Nanchangia anserum]|uniref:Helix-turn-helix domain-containing protein n=1 Tax=Nanchangia anserum TaxID=2692125 RepID=A0A8I0GEJ9_9ACTO|nr:helix-turn-helix domain-containing protein [Nanchangia anserum]MBD3690063.1 helix-turn-helix domain-containing protein [Nanchangia anserum]QOX82143.1 helix-turn-helix domain-containing protein [Nanchangia anserum]
MEQRFLTIADVSEILSLSPQGVRAMILSGELPAIQVGGRNQWRIEIAKLEDYIASRYSAAEEARRQAHSHTHAG